MDMTEEHDLDISADSRLEHMSEHEHEHTTDYSRLAGDANYSRDYITLQRGGGGSSHLHHMR